jgi:hypothetical protein
MRPVAATLSQSLHGIAVSAEMGEKVAKKGRWLQRVIVPAGARPKVVVR